MALFVIEGDIPDPNIGIPLTSSNADMKMLDTSALTLRYHMDAMWSVWRCVWSTSFWNQFIVDTKSLSSSSSCFKTNDVYQCKRWLDQCSVIKLHHPSLFLHSSLLSKHLASKQCPFTLLEYQNSFFFLQKNYTQINNSRIKARTSHHCTASVK